MKTKYQLGQEDKQAIKDAVTKAEEKTSGEIVVYYVRKCDNYEVTHWRMASLSMLAALLIIMGGHWFNVFYLTVFPVVSIILLFGVLGFVSMFNPALKRLFTPPELMEERVNERTETVFLEEEAFKTENRTGVVILISLLEHKVNVLGDTGINQNVEESDWKGIVEAIVSGIKQGAITQGICEGIQKTGTLLENSGLAKPAGNPNELPNKVRIEE